MPRLKVSVQLTLGFESSAFVSSHALPSRHRLRPATRSVLHAAMVCADLTWRGWGQNSAARRIAIPARKFMSPPRIGPR
jgi:hypothetical protein